MVVSDRAILAAVLSCRHENRLESGTMWGPASLSVLGMEAACYQHDTVPIARSTLSPRVRKLVDAGYLAGLYIRGALLPYSLDVTKQGIDWMLEGTDEQVPEN